MTDGLLRSRDAAALWGCPARGFTQRMAKWGVQPVVRTATTREGGKSHWWKPADVMRARSLAAKEAAKEAAEQAAKRPPEPTDEATRRKREHLAIIRRHYAQERWRKYWTAKDVARQTAKRAAKQATKEAR